MKGLGASLAGQSRVVGQLAGHGRVELDSRQSIGKSNFSHEENGVRLPPRGASFRGAVLGNGWEWCESKHTTVISLTRRILRCRSHAEVRTSQIEGIPGPTALVLRVVASGRSGRATRSVMR